MKDFFGFTKLKATIFVILCGCVLYVTFNNVMGPPNQSPWGSLALIGGSWIIIYLFLCAAFFGFKGKRNLLISVLVFLALYGILHLLGVYSAHKRVAADTACHTQYPDDADQDQYMNYLRCMADKGYVKYR